MSDKPVLPGFIQITHGDKGQYKSLVNLSAVTTIHANTSTAGVVIPGVYRTYIYTGPEEFMQACESLEEIMLLMAAALN